MNTTNLKYRTAQQAYEEIIAIDPDTALTKHSIRKLLSSGDIPVMKVGNKTLVSLDVLFDYLANSPGTSNEIGAL